MTDHDDVLRDLNEALNVEPSPAFADGVRARVVRSRARNRQLWWGLAAAASVTLATTLVWRPVVDVAAPVPATIASSQPTGSVQPGTGALSSPVSQETIAQEEAVVTGRGPTVAVTRPAAAPAVVMSTTAPAATSEPRLVVITNQGDVLRALWAGYDGRTMVETVAESAVPLVLGEIAPPLPIEVEPIVVAPIVVSELGSAGERGGAAPVIRRNRATQETR